MNRTFTTLWARDKWTRVRRYEATGMPLRVLYGGPHTSQPRFSRAGVSVGDWICPVGLEAGVLHMWSRMRVERIVPLDEFREELEAIAAGRMAGGPWYEVFGASGLLQFTCTDEVALGEGERIGHVRVPVEVLRALRYENRAGRQRSLKISAEGRMKNSTGVQGVYRLSAESGAMIHALWEGRELPVGSVKSGMW